MNGSGYFWKGLSDSISGWREGAVADERARKERDAAREKLALASAFQGRESGIDRAERARISDLQHASANKSYLSTGYASSLKHIDELHAAISRIEENYKLLQRPPSPEDARTIANLKAQVQETYAAAEQFKTEMGLKGELSLEEQIAAALASHRGSSPSAPASPAPRPGLSAPGATPPAYPHASPEFMGDPLAAPTFMPGSKIPDHVYQDLDYSNGAAPKPDSATYIRDPQTGVVRVKKPSERLGLSAIRNRKKDPPFVYEVDQDGDPLDPRIGSNADFVSKVF